MKKVISSIILIISMVGLLGCQSKTKDNVSEDISIGEKNSLSVEIIATTDEESLSKMPITLKPKVEGEYDGEIQYHWILKNNTEFEGFIVADNGPQKDLINLGEPIKLGLFAEVSWIDGATEKFKIVLQVEDKETTEIISSNEVIVENKQGIYSIE